MPGSITPLISWNELIVEARKLGVENFCATPVFQVSPRMAPRERFSLKSANLANALGALSLSFHDDFPIEYWLTQQGKLLLGSVPGSKPGKQLGGLSLHEFVKRLLVLEPTKDMRVVRVLRIDRDAYSEYHFRVFAGNMSELIEYTRKNGLKR